MSVVVFVFFVLFFLLFFVVFLCMCMQGTLPGRGPAFVAARTIRWSCSFRPRANALLLLVRFLSLSLSILSRSPLTARTTAKDEVRLSWVFVCGLLFGPCLVLACLFSSLVYPCAVLSCLVCCRILLFLWI